MSKSQNDEYFELLERIVKGAQYIDNPLIKDEDKEKALTLYNKLCNEALEIRNRKE